MKSQWRQVGDVAPFGEGFERVLSKVLLIQSCLVMLSSGLVTVGRELRQQHSRDFLFGGSLCRTTYHSDVVL